MRLFVLVLVSIFQFKKYLKFRDRVVSKKVESSERMHEYLSKTKILQYPFIMYTSITQSFYTS